MRWLIGLLGVGMLAGPAQARDLDNRLQAALACSKVTDAAERLACYDRAMVPLQQAAQTGALDARSLGPQARVGTVSAVRGLGYDSYIIALQNGDRWQLFIEGREREPKIGATASARRGAIGSWWIDIDKGSTFRAKFLGQPQRRAGR